MRTVLQSLNPEAVACVDARLAAIASEHNVTIPLAVESGSRAWGFPSPDSDYDCRFVFVRPEDDYLSLWQHRDVIETPLEGDLDVNGWDLAKAIRLMARGNAVIIEWLMSPLVYGGDPQFREDFLALARHIADRDAVARHYLHQGERFRDACFVAGGEVSCKKAFYALRPAAALRWLRLHECSVAPMHLPTLMAECNPPAGLADTVAALIARKANTAEADKEPLPEAVAQFINDELEAGRNTFEKRAPLPDIELRMEAETFFRATIQRLNSKE
ncbi:MAG: nucleotidyltransferase domain-containing protein [Alphaproteobacteria bacterium]